jgi:hypothetical protein
MTVAAVSLLPAKKGQQVAKVNVADNLSQEFRVQAIRSNTTIADWLGKLVERELRSGHAQVPVPAAVAAVEPEREAPFPIPGVGGVT